MSTYYDPMKRVAGNVSNSVLGTVVEVVPDAAPIYVSARDAVNNHLPKASYYISSMLDCTAFQVIGIASLRNIPYVYFPGNFAINDFYHFFASRFHYVEAALLCLASFVYNVAAALFFTILTGVTLGCSQDIRFGCEKHWINVGVSAACVGIGATGSLIPTFGLLGNAGLFILGMHYLAKQLESDIVANDARGEEKVKLKDVVNDLFESNKDLIYTITKKFTSRDKLDAATDYLIEFEDELSHVEIFHDVFTCIQTLFRQMTGLYLGKEIPVSKISSKRQIIPL